MATIDPNIALGVKPIQIENPMNQYAAMSQIQNAQNQNALAQYQLSAAKRADETTNIQNQLYAKHYDPKTGQVNKAGLFADLAQTPAAGLIPKLQAQFTDLEHKENVNKKTVAETTGLDYTQKMKQYNNAISHIGALNTPQEAIASIKESLAKGDIDQAKADTLVKSLEIAPNFLAWKKKLVLGSMDGAAQLHQQHQEATLAETGRHNIKTEGIQQQNVNIQGGQLNLAQQKFAFDTNPDLQANMTAVKKRAEENVKFETQGKIDVTSNRKALQQAGYDPISGKDDITQLIKDSTGSYLGKGRDIGARLYGEATEGSKALAALEQKSNAITFGLLNGKLGAGISKSDAELVASLVGRLNDGTLPVDDRLAAWDSAKNMMKTLGMVESSTSLKNSPTSSTNSTNVKPSLNEIFSSPTPTKTK
jgi:hypothetical protein